MSRMIAGWWFGTIFFFPYIGNFIIQTDELHHFSEGLAATTNPIIIPLLATIKPLLTHY